MMSRALVEKRLLDLTLLVATSAVWVPLTASLALLVLLLEGRPVLFLQRRVGRDRVPFSIFKLRTMTCEDDVASRRPTRFGAWLRERGLDELPQLLNVLRGEMSLVGPRPLSEADAERLVASHPPLAARFAAPPGITGLAQVTVTRGVERTALLEAAYARHRTNVLDLTLLIRTAWINVVGKQRGQWRVPEGMIPDVHEPKREGQGSVLGAKGTA